MHTSIYRPVSTRISPPELPAFSVVPAPSTCHDMAAEAESRTVFAAVFAANALLGQILVDYACPEPRRSRHAAGMLDVAVWNWPAV